MPWVAINFAAALTHTLCCGAGERGLSTDDLTSQSV
jgi:hypothetical protein